MSGNGSWGTGTFNVDELELYPLELDTSAIKQLYGTPILHTDLTDGSTWGSSDVGCVAAGGRCPSASEAGARFNQRQHLTANAALPATSFTFSTWIKPETRQNPMGTASELSNLGIDTTQDWQGVFGYTDPNNHKKIYPSLYVSNAGRLRLYE